MTDTVWLEIVRTIGTVSAAAAAYFGYRNGQKADRIEVASTTAAQKAETAVVKAQELHVATQKVVAQTNGNIDSLMQELAKVREQAARTEAFNTGLQQTIATLSSILAAQRVAPIAAPGTLGTADAAPVAMRRTDVTPAINSEHKEK